MGSEGFFERVYEVVEQIPEGMVATYGQVALLAGRPRSARYVGYALHSNPRPGQIPCHRVVGSNGSLTGYAGGIRKKLALLELEHIDVSRFTIPSSGTAL